MRSSRGVGDRIVTLLQQQRSPSWRLAGKARRQPAHGDLRLGSPSTKLKRKTGKAQREAPSAGAPELRPGAPALPPPRQLAAELHPQSPGSSGPSLPARPVAGPLPICRPEQRERAGSRARGHRRPSPAEDKVSVLLAARGHSRPEISFAGCGAERFYGGLGRKAGRGPRIVSQGPRTRGRGEPKEKVWAPREPWGPCCPDAQLGFLADQGTVHLGAEGGESRPLTVCSYFAAPAPAVAVADPRKERS